MQEIQALKLALESGGMDLKERGETHQRFVGLLRHLKAMLATYKELRGDKGDVATNKELLAGDDSNGANCKEVR